MKKYFLICSLLLLHLWGNTIPPEPPLGFRWVIIKNLSDEFNGEALNENKWNDHHPYWQGRPPAKFVPEAISVKDGLMQIKNGVLAEPDGEFKYSGGAVVSKSQDAYLGYYECKTKASKTRMSTTFWMSNRGANLNSITCANDSYSLELDIQECIGDANKWEGFKKKMNSNTHYWYTDCTGEKITYSKGSNILLDSDVAENYHIYGAWWKNENEVTFYADDNQSETVFFLTDASNKPFDRPMAINMVTETYSWEAEPRIEVLNDDSRNTSYYDWIRSYKLLPIDSVETEKESVLLKNGDFETGNLDGWQGWGGNPKEVSNIDVYEGNYCIHIKGAGAPEQEIILKKNTDYTHTCMAKVVSGQVLLGIKPSSGSNEAITSFTFSENEYTQANLGFNTGNNSGIKLYLYAPSANDEAFADNFSLVQTNEDTTTQVEVFDIFNQSIKFKQNQHLFSNGTYNFTFQYQCNEHLFLDDTFH